MGVFGDTLRQARAYKGVTIKEVEQATRINRHHLVALEDENFSALPPLIYQRGIIRNYATYLDLDPSKLLAMFEEAYGAGSGSQLVAAMKPLDMPSHWAPNFAIIAFMVVMSAVVFAWAYSAYFAPQEQTATAQPMIPTVTPVGNSSIVLPTATPIPSPDVPAQPTAVAEVPTAITQEMPSVTAVTSQAAETDAPRTDPPAPPQTAVVEPPQEAAVEQEPPASGDVLTLSFRASADVYLSIVADGISVWEGPLAAGQTTQQYQGQNFEVYTTDIKNTHITNYASGEEFVMGGSGEGSFSLP